MMWSRLMTSLRSSKLLPWLVLATGLAATYLLQQLAFNAARQIQQHDFTDQTREINLRIEQRLLAYEQVLRGIEGLYIASKEVDREEFRNYTANLRLEQQYPGMQEVGYSLIIAPHEKARHVKAIRKEGFPDYSLHPKGQRDLYTSAVFLEPFTATNRRAFGFDMYAEAVRRAAMELARDTDKAAMSGKVTLVQETAQDVHAGFLMYVPVYRNGSPHETLAERRANIIGWVHAAFRMNDLMHGILGEQISSVDLHIFDGENTTPETLMYDTDADFSRNLTNPSLYQASQRITVSGHTWTIDLGSLPDFETNFDTGRIAAIRWVGILTSVLLALLVWLLVNGRRRALDLAQAMTTELRKSEHHLHDAQAMAHIGSWDYNLVTGKLTWTEEMYRVYGVSPETFTPSIESLLKATHHDDQPALQAWIAACASGQKMQPLEFRCIWPDGTVRYIEGHGELILDAEGKPEHTSGTFQDITGRKFAEMQVIDEKKKLSAVIDNVLEGIITISERGMIESINPAARHIFGYTDAELLGQNVKILMPEPYLSEHDGYLDHHITTGEKKIIGIGREVSGQRKDGSTFPMELSVSEVVLENHRYFIGIIRDITARKAAEEEIRSLAFYDPLTHLPNRRLLMDRFKQALASSARSGKTGALLFLDLDKFKTLNDTLGHDIGDLLLQQVAQRLESCVRTGDTVARLGGDEFVVMLENLNDQALEAAVQTKTIGEKILAALNQPYQLAAHEYRSTASVGATLFNGNEREMVELLKQADIAMYQAKQAGRNALRFFDPQMR